MKIRVLPFVLLVVALSGCAPAAAQTPSVSPEIRAVYLAPKEGGTLAADDLAAHPEVALVTRMDDLKRAAAGGVPVWIDRDAAAGADMVWLRALDCPIVVVGCGDGLYAFGGLLDFGIEIPQGTTMDESAPGFSVWATVTEKSGFVSQRMKGFQDRPIRVEEIFSAIEEVTAL
jgi:hypothetical protein